MRSERTAGSTVVVGARCVAVLGGGHTPPSELVDALLADDPSDAFLAHLTAAGITRLPDFGFISWEEAEVRVVIRGSVSVRLRSDDGAGEELSAPTIRTWQESVRPRPARLEVIDDGDVVAVVPLDELSAVTTPSEDQADDPIAEPAPPVRPVDPHETVLPAAGVELVDVQDLPHVVAGDPVPTSPDSDDVDLSHLFETRHHGVEAAAVREEQEDAPGVEPEPEPELRPGPVGDVSPVSATPAASRPTRTEQSPPPAETPPILISFVPGGSSSPPPPAERPGVAPLAAESGAAADGGGALDESTVAKVGASSPARSTRPRVQAVTCPAGHFDAPHADRCRSCGAEILDRTIQLVQRPAVGHLRFEDGRTVDVDRPLLVGRKPTVDAIGDADEVPGLVTLPDPEGVLSRVHAELRIEGWEVLVVDRGSTNGTRVEIPGQPPIVLRPGEPCGITAGTTVAFADAASATFEVGPR